MRFLSVFVVGLWLPVWGVSAQDFKFEPPARAVAMPAGPGRTLPLTLTRMAANIPAGTPWAEMSAGSVPFPCKQRDLLKWEESDNALPTETFARILREELKAAGFSTSGDPTNLFESEAAKPEFQLGALM